MKREKDLSGELFRVGPVRGFIGSGSGGEGGMRRVDGRVEVRIIKVRDGDDDGRVRLGCGCECE